MNDPRILAAPMKPEDAAKVTVNVPTPAELEEMNNIFAHHPPTGSKGRRHELVRARALDFAFAIHVLCPPSPERTEAIRLIRNAMFYANAAVACHPEPEAKPQ